jgi:hypothetical protein
MGWAMIDGAILRRVAWSLLLTFCVGCIGPSARSTHILFIGNSYIFENDLPSMFAALARAGDHPVAVDMIASGGWTLTQHAQAAETRDKIGAQPWNFVVLQEKSVIPALATQRTTSMYPAVRQLTRAVRARGAQPVLLLTWGRRDGLADAGFGDFATMQAQLTAGYLAIADELDLLVAPAGVAWQAGLARDRNLLLWQGDGSHPSQVGSYLTACVLYAALFRESPVGLAAPAGFSAELAQRLQTLAGDTVLTNPARWHIRDRNRKAD